MSKAKPIAPSPAAIIRSQQKDEVFIGHIRKEFNEIFQKWFGMRDWIIHCDKLEFLSRISYFAMTTWSGMQTLGEEHTLLLLIQSQQLKLPSLLRRVMLVIAHCGGYVAITKSLNRISQALDQPDEQLWPDWLNQPETRAKLYDRIPTIRALIASVLKLNVALFYINGAYLTFSNRLFSTEYTALSKWKGDGTSQSLYKFLGYLSLSQLIFSAAAPFISNLVLKQNDKQRACSSSEHSITSSFGDLGENLLELNVPSRDVKCGFCFGDCTNTTAVACGHLFCWDCIHKWLQNRNECPVCRHPTKQSRLIFLQNF